MSIDKDLLIPVKKFTPCGGRFVWPRQAVLASPRVVDQMPLGQLADDLAAVGAVARVKASAGLPAAVRIVRDRGVRGAEAYRLTVAADGVEIRSSADAGAYYGVQTLREMAAASGRSLPCCVVDDAPAFARRGVYHDCSRGKVPKLSTLKDLVTHLGRWKINELQLYVENVFAFRSHPGIDEGYSALSAEEILALQEHCKAHHVRLVGSLASFGHLERVLVQPRYKALGEFVDPDKKCSTLCPTDPRSIALLAELYAEYVPLFEAVDFNICGDETWELGKGRSKRRADRIGIGGLYKEFLLKVYRLCQKHGKRMNMWADIVLEHPESLEGWPSDVVMLNWDYDPHGSRVPRTREITDRGLACMVCPGTNSWASHGCRLRHGQRNIREFTAEGIKRGAEGVLNTDWGDGNHRNPLGVSLANMAYGGACSWNLRGVEDRGFMQRFCRHTFGREGWNLSGALETLGSLDESVGLPWPQAYWGLWMPLAGLKREEAPFDPKVCARLEAHARKLERLSWPAPEKAATKFLAATYADFAVAAHLDAFACRWLIAIKHVQAAKGVPNKANLITQSRETIAHLKKIWPSRNKPSRFFQIVQGFKNLEHSCAKVD